MTGGKLSKTVSSVIAVFSLCQLLVACSQVPSPQPASPFSCRVSSTKRVTATDPTVTVSYTEPTTNAAGLPLTNLAKTTIYYDMGAGPVRAREVPASRETGGGAITQTISIPLKQKPEATVCVFVTATNTEGVEGSPLR
jgi:hypothetical protein